MYGDFPAMATTATVSIGGTTFTSSSCFVTKIDINKSYGYNDSIQTIGGSFLNRSYGPGKVEIEITLECTDESFKTFCFGNNKQSVKNKLVNDCTVEELIFAARKKLEEERQ